MRWERFEEHRGRTLADALSAWMLEPDHQDVVRDELASRPPRRGRQWGLDALAFVGAEVERIERAAWREASVAMRPDPARDTETTALWAAWFAGDPWSGRGRWEALFLDEAVRVFMAVLRARKIPDSARGTALEDLRESFFYSMVMGDIPGWAELAARTLETGPEGPVPALRRLAGPTEQQHLSSCAATRGTRADTLSRLWSERPDPAARAHALATYLAEGGALESLLDAHTVLRLLSSWSSGQDDPGHSWAVVTQNRGRARARVRAVLVEHGRPRMLEPLLVMDALWARTAAATRRLAWSWAWRELGRGLSFDLETAGTRRCKPVDLGHRPLDARERAALKTWVLLAVLKGRLTHLQRWVRTGSTGDRDATWGRLLANELPTHLRGDDGRPVRVRVELADTLDDLLVDLRPALAALAELPTGRKLRAAFTAELEPRWAADVPFPKSGFPTFHRQAVAALEVIDDRP